MTSAPRRLLVVEDDDALRATLRVEFEDRGFEVCEAAGLPDLERIDLRAVSHAAVDLRLAASSGLEAVERIRRAAPAARIVVMTGYGSIPTAVEAVKRGAHNYLTKPLTAAKLEEALLAGTEPPAHPAPRKSRGEGETLARHERDYIDYVLLQCGGNITRAARWLGLHRQSLQRKLKKYT